jgi:hypothetical protein
MGRTFWIALIALGLGGVAGGCKDHIPTPLFDASPATDGKGDGAGAAGDGAHGETGGDALASDLASEASADGGDNADALGSADLGVGQ